MIHIFRLAFVIVLLLAGPAGAQSVYSDEPLEATLLFEPAELLIKSVTINNWLNENYEHLPEEYWPQLREELYSLIGAAVRSRFQSSGVLTGSEDLPMVWLLFSWASRLGVVGADLVAEVLAPEGMLHTERHVSPHFDVSYNESLIAVQALDGAWSVHVPYYFMIWELTRIEVDGFTTDVMVTSTLHSPHIGQEGTSQSTIMLLVNADVSEGFRENWLTRFGIDWSDPRPSDLVEGGHVYSGESSESQVQMEALFWESEGHGFAVIYSGLPGPFSDNHVHFEDFVIDLIR